MMPADRDHHLAADPPGHPRGREHRIGVVEQGPAPAQPPSPNPAVYLSARSTPGERPGGCWGLSGSLTYTSAPLASSILPTQLVAVLGMPVTSSGAPPLALTCGR
jgi:hypothetical protein